MAAPVEHTEVGSRCGGSTPRIRTLRLAGVRAECTRVAQAVDALKGNGDDASVLAALEAAANTPQSGPN